MSDLVNLIPWAIERLLKGEYAVRCIQDDMPRKTRVTELGTRR